ncbi:SDR family NAD(P)-dependent oxidoreductase [Oceanithermus sp.]|uniref:SDR family NAD(P)-dependent oxidoreductase n=1 Tax=Oceanithermus sp. TaxID=2268145 RepID=UPI0025DCBEC7|nr:SDR family NAD(P)-dependent oxidoreductase [Oceanithermus sp.]
MSARYRRVWITGGSSGIGHALARRYARAGAHVVVSSRNAEKLAEVARETGGAAYPLDVTDPEAVARVVGEIWEKEGPVDLAILNAGAAFKRAGRDDTAENLKKHLDVNLLGVAYALDALRPRMREAGGGTIALVGSLAGYVGLPRTSGYGTSKAALAYYAEALWAELRREKIDLKLVSPGFVKTPIVAANEFPMPFILEADAAARIIARGLERPAFEVAFPRRLAWPLRLLRVLPASWRVALIAAGERRAGRKR